MIKLHPQPVGIFAHPASNLILPAVEDDRGALKNLLMGKSDIEFPIEWEFYFAAIQGDRDTAISLLGNDSSDLNCYNRFVLGPSAEAYAKARLLLTNQWREILDVAAFIAGVIDEIQSEFTLENELLAFALATSAAADLEKNCLAEAASKLKQAIQEARSHSTLLAAILTAQHADVMVATPGYSPALAINAYQEAIRLGNDCELPLFLAELQMKLGLAYQNAANGQRGPLLEAVNAYQAALQQGINEAEHPEMFAQVQNNLGLAYLSMPASETSNQLRTGIAVQSFRHALKIFTRENHPDMWASVSMNLANALVYAPSSHPEENLIQAVETYEEILLVRSRAKDHVAYALVLLNQANALAHLGIFKPALEKLAEAYKLFHWYEQIEQANAAKELLEQINLQMGNPASTAELTNK